MDTKRENLFYTNLLNGEFESVSGNEMAVLPSLLGSYQRHFHCVCKEKLQVWTDVSSSIKLGKQSTECERRSELQWKSSDDLQTQSGP